MTKTIDDEWWLYIPAVPPPFWVDVIILSSDGGGINLTATSTLAICCNPSFLPNWYNGDSSTVLIRGKSLLAYLDWIRGKVLVANYKRTWLPDTFDIQEYGQKRGQMPIIMIEINTMLIKKYSNRKMTNKNRYCILTNWSVVITSKTLLESVSLTIIALYDSFILFLYLIDS